MFTLYPPSSNSLASSATKTFCPPLSTPPGAARGEACSLMNAILFILISVRIDNQPETSLPFPGKTIETEFFLRHPSRPGAEGRCNGLVIEKASHLFH